MGGRGGRQAAGLCEPLRWACHHCSPCVHTWLFTALTHACTTAQRTCTRPHLLTDVKEPGAKGQKPRWLTHSAGLPPPPRPPHLLTAVNEPYEALRLRASRSALASAELRSEPENSMDLRARAHVAGRVAPQQQCST